MRDMHVAFLTSAGSFVAAMYLWHWAVHWTFSLLGLRELADQHPVDVVAARSKLVPAWLKLGISWALVFFTAAGLLALSTHVENVWVLALCVAATPPIFTIFSVRDVLRSGASAPQSGVPPNKSLERTRDT